MENRGEIAHELAEIHTSVGREEKDYLAVIEGVFHRNQLHFKPVGGNFFAAYSEGFLFLFVIFLKMSKILFVGNSHDLFERNFESLGDFGIFRGAHAAFKPLCRLYNDLLPLLNGNSVGVKIIRLSAVFKFHANYNRHFFNSVIL